MDIYNYRHSRVQLENLHPFILSCMVDLLRKDYVKSCYIDNCIEICKKYEEINKEYYKGGCPIIPDEDMYELIERTFGISSPNAAIEAEDVSYINLHNFFNKFSTKELRDLYNYFSSTDPDGYEYYRLILFAIFTDRGIYDTRRISDMNFNAEGACKMLNELNENIEEGFIRSYRKGK